MKQTNPNNLNKKRKILKRILLSVFSVLISIGIYGYLILVFMPNSLDMLFFGNSDSYNGISPMELYKETGSTSYVVSASLESIQNIESNLKDCLHYQKPKVVVLDVECMFRENNYFTGSRLYKLYPLASPFLLHSRWKELSINDFFTLPLPKKSLFKGYHPETHNSHFGRPDKYMEELDAEPAVIEKSKLQNFKNIVNICQKNNITLELICLPTPYSWDNAKSNSITNLANTYNLSYLDLNLPQDGFDFDYDNYFKDQGSHLNVLGSVYTTKYLASYFKNKHNLPDHRDEESYAEWNDFLIKYEEKMTKLKAEVD